ncbi:MAG: protein kinase, partial [Clostridia bacterium]|nr:protein kinase [Clostridia bacterium]
MIGTIVGHKYRITELLGTGGMSHVYKAYNLATRRTVAIKVLKEEFRENAEFLRRFEREARAVLHLTHENIVRAYGVGETGGMPYIVLEYVEGQTLKKLIADNGPLPPRIAVGLINQVLDALDAAHSAGIVHRDVKPQNVIVTRSGRAKLTDFGIARDVEASTRTFSGNTVLGSVHYLSPEQAMGKPVAATSDIYSAGVMLYEMLTGELPFNADNSVSVALMHISDEAPAPLEKNPRLPQALNDIVLRAMQKDVAARYQSALAMQKHLLRALREPSGSFARTGAGDTPAKKKRGSRIRMHGALKIGLCVAALILLLAGLFIGLRASYTRRSVATQIVPALTGRSVEEARTRAENYDFYLEIQEYEPSDTVPYGGIITQSPEAGVRSMTGTAIQVIVSIGPDALLMPDLTGMTPDEAAETLTASGLLLGDIRYQVSDVAIGYVCGQSVLPDTEVRRGLRVDITLSASSEDSFSMPSVSAMPLTEALRLLSGDAFSDIFVRYTGGEEAEGGVEHAVLEQLPAAGESIGPGTVVYLNVSGVCAGEYAADVAFNIEVEESGAAAMAVMLDADNGVSYYHILYEATLEKGARVPLSFTAYSDSEGLREL